MHNPFNEHFVTATVNSLWFWFLALSLMCISYKVMDTFILPKIHITKKLEEGNVAVAIVVAAFLGAIGLVIFGITN